MCNLSGNVVASSGANCHKTVKIGKWVHFEIYSHVINVDRLIVIRDGCHFKFKSVTAKTHTGDNSGPYT